MIAFDCPKCGFAMKAPDTAAGKRGPCKKCGETVTVPAAAVPSPVPQIIEAAPVSVAVVSPSPMQPRVIEQPAISPLVRRLTNDEQDPATVEKIVAKVEPLLMTGEELKYVAVQQRPIANFAPDAIVLTDKRMMLFQTKLLGRYDFQDWVWRELGNCKIKEGMLGATISIQTSSRQLVSLDYLPKKQAREVYRYAQEKEEAAHEERRQRALEEKRAAAGGTTVAVQANPSQPAPAADPVAKLAQLKQMLDAGLISQGEFDQKKAAILAAM
jgi:hypothetical protein